MSASAILEPDQAYRLFNGDFREVLHSFPDRSVDFVFTDPPYGHRNNDRDLIANWERALGKRGKNEAPRPIKSDGEEATPIFWEMLIHAKRLLSGGCCCCCCCGGGGPDPQFARWSELMDRTLDFVQMVVWDKGPMGMGWKYRRSYETILVGMKPGGKMRWFDESNRVENIIRPGNGIKKIIPSILQHPTEKPPELAAHFIKLHTKPGDVVLDPFMGSGSTGEAAIKLGRRFIGIELDAEFFRMADERLAGIPLSPA